MPPDAYEANLASWRGRRGRRLIWAFVPIAYLVPVAADVMRGEQIASASRDRAAILGSMLTIVVGLLHRRAFGSDDDGPSSPTRI